MKKRDKRDRLEQREERKNARGRRLDFLLNKEGIYLQKDCSVDVALI